MPEITTLPKNPYSYGMIIRFLAAHKPFASFEFGPTALSIFHQMDTDAFLVAVEQDKIVGYLGWIRTTEELGRDWLENGATLRGSSDGTAVAVTIFAATDPRTIRPMIREAKKREPGLTVFWKRYYQDGRSPIAKVVEVL